jgi:hypothetical protein
MADPLFDELNATTLKEIYPEVVRDNFFRNSPFLAYLRHHCLVPFGGGVASQHTFAYAPLNGGFYAPGANFNITVRPVLAGTLFEPRYAYVDVSEYKEMIQVLNKGVRAVFSIIDTKLRIAMNTISAIVAVALSRHGQPAGAGVIGNRPTCINGWIEAMNDRITPGWDGSRFIMYGGQDRNGIVGSALNSIPQWCGDAAGNPGPITYNLLEEGYQDVSITGIDRPAEEPDLGVGNKAVIAYMKERLVVQQRFAQERDPIWGLMGFRFNSAMVLKDDYFPSLRYGVNDPDLGNFLTGTFVVPAGFDPRSSLPAAGITVTVAEVFCWLNTKTWALRISDDAEYGFGWSGFMPDQDNTRVAGQVKAALNLECDAPRLNKQYYGIGG